MALTIKMQIDEHDEHQYYFATGDDNVIELIPLVVNENGIFEPDEGKGFSKVTVSVPEPIFDTLVCYSNGTYTAPDGHCYSVVTVDVSAMLQNKSVTITQNGNSTIECDSGYDGLDRVTVSVNVPNTYSAGDEGKVVDNGSLVSQTSRNINQNGTYDTTTNNEAVVAVPNTYTQSDEGKVVDNATLVAQNPIVINQNGTYNTTKNNQTVVAVPNTYTQSDEGKVVENGTLVAQGTQTITQNGSYDTTLIKTLIANIAGTTGDIFTLEGNFTATDNHPTTVQETSAIDETTVPAGMVYKGFLMYVDDADWVTYNANTLAGGVRATFLLGNIKPLPRGSFFTNSMDYIYGFGIQKTGATGSSVVGGINAPNYWTAPANNSGYRCCIFDTTTRTFKYYTNNSTSSSSYGLFSGRKYHYIMFYE